MAMTDKDTELRELIEKWRTSGHDGRITPDAPIQAIEQCADELEAVLDDED